MKVFVIGGTGALGAHTVPALVAAGHDVVALARSQPKADQLAKQGARPHRVSLYDTKALGVALQGCNAVVNIATAIPPLTQFMRSGAWKENTRVRTEGAASVVRAALTAKVPRIIQESVSMLYPDHGEKWVDETVRPDPFPMAMPNLSAESCIERFSLARKAGVVLRFGWFYGPGAAHSETFFAMARYGLAVQMGRAAGYLSSIHMHDAARAVVAALDVPAGVYNVVDDEPLTKRAYAEAIANGAGRKRWVGVPGVAANWLGHRTTSLTRSLRVSNALFKKSTSWAPTYASAREGFAIMGKQR